jgi:transglutaminase superfamily protein
MSRETRDLFASFSHCQLPSTRLSTQPGRQPVRFLLWRALVGLTAFDLLGYGRDFSRMHRFVRGYKVVQRKPSADIVERVCEAVNHACVWYPKRVLCLQRSAVTTSLLRACGVPAAMVMGAQNLPFQAHAWTEVDGRTINERRDVGKIYAVLERL